FVPAITRIDYFSTTQVLVGLFVLLTVTPLTGLLLKSAKTTTEMEWGVMPARAGYALVLNAVMVILLMTLMGYARSSSRVHWHIYGVMQDTSPYAYSPALGYAAAFMSLNTFLFCLMVAFIFWVASLGGEKGDVSREAIPDEKKQMKTPVTPTPVPRSEEHTSELQSRGHLVCRLLLEKKKWISCTHPRRFSQLDSNNSSTLRNRPNPCLLL